MGCHRFLNDNNRINIGLPFEETDEVQDSYNLLPVRPETVEI